MINKRQSILGLEYIQLRPQGPELIPSYDKYFCKNFGGSSHSGCRTEQDEAFIPREACLHLLQKRNIRHKRDENLYFL